MLDQHLPWNSQVEQAVTIINALVGALYEEGGPEAMHRPEVARALSFVDSALGRH